MSNFDSDGSSSNEWEDRGDLVWNEFDWERYLREQDDAIRRYQGFYEAAQEKTDRVDLVAEQMGWDIADWTDDIDDNSEDDDDDDEDSDDEADAGDVYTLHKNPIFIATKAIALSLQQSWQLTATGDAVTPSLAIAILSSLHRSEEQAVQAIHALDFGDYAMAISLFKRALSVLNSSLALLNGDEVMKNATLTAFREVSLPRLFDLREIWLRVINECRDELDRSTDDDA